MLEKYTKGEQKTLVKYGVTEDVLQKMDAEMVIYETITNYKWKVGKENFVSAKTDKVSAEFYANVVSAIPFFRNLGGKEYVSMDYLSNLGKIPRYIKSVSPNGEFITIRSYVFHRA